MVKFFINKVEIPFTTTIFPDGTSQVWKLAALPRQDDDVEILWIFENEAELFHVMQIAHLIQSLDEDVTVVINAPYLPYGRQDKDVSNTSSFALQTFMGMCEQFGVYSVKTFDPHSRAGDVVDGTSRDVADFHEHVFNHDVICYPDKGAVSRYIRVENAEYIFCEKRRDQLTGNITGLDVIPVKNRIDLTGKRILIVDDICDGGMTFIKVAEALKVYNPASIDLCVSHGLFSKGKQVLHDAGINQIFTTNSLLRNPEAYKVW